MHNELVISFYVAVEIPYSCAFNNIAQRLKSGLFSSLKVRLVAYTAPRLKEVNDYISNDNSFKF